MNESVSELVPILNNTNLFNVTTLSVMITNTENVTTAAPLFMPCNNPRNLLSSSVAETVDLIVYAGLFPILVTFGVISNVINMAVFARQGLSDRINLCLCSLAVADTGFLLFLMCGKSYALVSLLDAEAGSYWQQRYNGTVLGTYLGFIVTSTAVTALIAVERCICVVSPFKAKKFFKTKYLGIAIVLMGVYALTVKNTALSLKYLTVQVSHPVTNTTTYVSRLTPFYLAHKTIIDVIYSDLLSVTVPALSLAVVVVCTSVTIVKLKMSLNWRHASASSNMTSTEKREAAVTRMLMTVCCVYVICMTPSVTRTFVLHRLPGFLISGHLCNTFKVTTAVVHLLEAFNASANFVIYFKQGSRYRSTLRQLCGRLVRHKDQKRTSQDVSLSTVSGLRESSGHQPARRTVSFNPSAESGHM